ncbi:MAG TPA: FtsQ-type POTRA domain-containing protein [Solirubrobacteraceae bacterium]|jgi:cell division protein FtsQ
MIAEAIRSRRSRYRRFRARRLRTRRSRGGRTGDRPLLRSLALPRPRPKVIALAVAVLALGLGAWLWFRDSSLVSVKRVAVTGVSGPDAGRIRDALETAARNMTTLDVKTDQLNTAVGPYPVVKKLQVSTQFPHGMRIHVVEEIPVAEVQVGGRNVAVADDGTLLHDAPTTTQLPLLQLRSSPGGSQLTQQDGLSLVTLLAAAPYQMLSRVSQASTSSSHGLVAQLRDGPSIYFGGDDHLGAKWIAADAVLLSSGSSGAEYIDVSDPERPVAGATAATSSTATGTTPSTATATTPSTTTATTPAPAAATTPTTVTGG